MLTELDDLLTHQTFETHDRVFMDDPRWTERFIIEVHDQRGDVFLFTGLGIYPNTQYMDGFAICWHENRQHNLRAGRELGDKRWQLQAGPLAFEIVDPMNTWRLAAGDAGFGFSFDIEFARRTQPFQMPTMLIERGGEIMVGYSHFVQAGRYSGWIEVDGKRYDVDGWTGERDRSWGVRPASARTRKGLHTWLPIQFEDESIWLWTRDDKHGNQAGLCGAIRPVDLDAPGAPVEITGYRHDLKIELVRDHRVLRGGRLEIDAADGRTLRLEVEPLGPVISLIGGGYGGEHAQGTPKGPLFVDGEVWDFNEAGRFEAISHSILEHPCRFSSPDGRIGYGCFELCIGEYAPFGLGPIS
jgi:hypothetical protein